MHACTLVSARLACVWHARAIDGAWRRACMRAWPHACPGAPRFSPRQVRRARPLRVPEARLPRPTAARRLRPPGRLRRRSHAPWVVCPSLTVVCPLPRCRSSSTPRPASASRPSRCASSSSIGCACRCCLRRREGKGRRPRRSCESDRSRWRRLMGARPASDQRSVRGSYNCQHYVECEGVSSKTKLKFSHFTCDAPDAIAKPKSKPDRPHASLR